MKRMIKSDKDKLLRYSDVINAIRSYFDGCTDEESLGELDSLEELIDQIEEVKETS